jgi:hypothetical protein
MTGCYVQYENTIVESSCRFVRVVDFASTLDAMHLYFFILYPLNKTTWKTSGSVFMFYFSILSISLLNHSIQYEAKATKNVSVNPTPHTLYMCSFSSSVTSTSLNLMMRKRKNKRAATTPVATLVNLSTCISISDNDYV